MPKIKITEKDLTSSGLSVAADNVVYIPGPTASAPAGGVEVLVEPTLCTNLSELNKLNVNKESLSFKLAKYIVNSLGLYVLYEGIASTASEVSEYSWTRLEDKTGYDIRFLTTGQYGYADQKMVDCAKKRGDSIALVDHSKTINEQYGEYVLLTEKPEDWEEGQAVPANTYFTKAPQTYSFIPEGSEVPEFVLDKYYTKTTTALYILLTTKPEDWETNYIGYFTKDVIEIPYPALGETYPPFAQDTYYKKVIVTNNAELVRQYFATKITNNGEYAAAFTPWFKTASSEFGATKTNMVDIPACFGYIFAYARSIQNNPEWYAIAGSSRGIISELVEPLVKYSNAECEILQARSANGEVDLDEDGDNVGVAINPIAPIRPFGTIIWGNRTMLNNTLADGLKATSFLNVRNLVSTVKKVLYKAARTYTFAQNDSALWFNFKSAITPTLENMKSGNGILGYRLTQVQTNKKARLKAYLVIVPIEAVEDFEIEIELNDSIEVAE